MFGVFPTQAPVGYIAKGFDDVFQPTKLDANPVAWEKVFQENAVTPLRVTGYGTWRDRRRPVRSRAETRAEGDAHRCGGRCLSAEYRRPLYNSVNRLGEFSPACPLGAYAVYAAEPWTELGLWHFPAWRGTSETPEMGEKVGRGGGATTRAIRSRR